MYVDNSRDAVTTNLALNAGHQVPHAAFGYQSKRIDQTLDRIAPASALIGELQFAFLPDRSLKHRQKLNGLIRTMPPGDVHVNALASVLGAVAVCGGQCCRKLDERCVCGFL